MDLGLERRAAVVTGASRGLGRAIALALASEGAHVTAVARNPQPLLELPAVGQGAGRIATCACDLSKASDIERLREPLEKADVLILNTGGPPPGGAMEPSDRLWSEQFEAMFLSAIRLTRLALPGMRARRFGRLIAIVSSSVEVPIPALVISNSIRLALVGWAKTLAAEVAAEGITVNCLAPGRIATDRLAQLDEARARREGISLDEVEHQSRRSIPAGRYGEPEEFGAMAAFLCSPRAGYITGSVIRVDGGLVRSI